MRVTCGSDRVGQEAEGVREKHGQEPLLRFPQEGPVGRFSRLRMGWCE